MPTRVLPVTAPLDVIAPLTFTIPVPLGFNSMLAFVLIFSIVLAALLIFKLPNSGELASEIVTSSVFCVSATLLSPFKLLKRNTVPALSLKMPTLSATGMLLTVFASPPDAPGGSAASQPDPVHVSTWLVVGEE